MVDQHWLPQGGDPLKVLIFKDKSEVPRLRRHQVPKIPYQPRFHDVKQFVCWAGYATLTQADKESSRYSRTRAAQVNILLFENPGDSSHYFALIRKPEGYPERLDVGDSFRVYWPDAHDKNESACWDGKIVRSPPYASYRDAAAILTTEPRDKPKSLFVPTSIVEAEELAQVLDKPNPEELLRQKRGERAFLGMAHSDNIYDHRNDAIRTINPYDKVEREEPRSDDGEEQVSRLGICQIAEDNPIFDLVTPVLNNEKWNFAFVGKPIGKSSTPSVLRRDDLYALFNELLPWIDLSEEQKQALTMLTRIPNGFGIVQGVEGSGKSLLDCLMGFAARRGTKKPVIFVSEGNAAADSLCTRMVEILLQMGESREKAESMCQRLYAESTEDSLFTMHVEQFFTINSPYGASQGSGDTLQHAVAGNMNETVDKAYKDRHQPRDSRVTDWRLSVMYHTLQCHGFLDRKKVAMKPGAKSVFKQDLDSAATDEKIKSIMDQEMLALTSLGPQGPQGSHEEKTRSNAVQIWRRLAMKLFELWERGELGQRGKRELCAYIRGLTQNQLQNQLGFLFTTAHALQNETVYESVDPSLVIIQEAGRFIPLDLAVAIHRFTCPVVSSFDPKQLRPLVIDLETNPWMLQFTRSIAERLVADEYSSVSINTTRRQGGFPAKFLSKFFYGGKMQSLAPERPIARELERYMLQRFKKETALAFFNVADSYSESVGHNNSKINDRENETILKFAKDIHTNADVKYDEIVWLTPYVSNVRSIERLLSSQNVEHQGLTSIKVSTIDSFQGEQAEVILLGMTNAVTIGFMDDERRQCVAFTRFRSAMMIFQNWSNVQQRCSRDSDRHWKEMVSYLKAEGCYFDLSANQ